MSKTSRPCSTSIHTSAGKVNTSETAAFALVTTNNKTKVVNINRKEQLTRLEQSNGRVDLFLFDRETQLLDKATKSQQATNQQLSKSQNKVPAYVQAANMEQVAALCATECIRQHVNLDRTRFLMNAYLYALKNAERKPTHIDMLYLAGVLEPSSQGSYRKTPVRFANGGSSAKAETIPSTVERMFEMLDEEVDPREFTRHFLWVHPFSDGNGRTGFVLWNWLNGSLNEPAALPDFNW